MNIKGDMSNMAIVQPTEQPRTSPPGSRAPERMPRILLRMSDGVFVSRVIATGAARCVLSELEKLLKLDS